MQMSYDLAQAQKHSDEMQIGRYLSIGREDLALDDASLSDKTQQIQASTGKE